MWHWEQKVTEDIIQGPELCIQPRPLACVKNEIRDALSWLCGAISKTEHTPDDNIRLLPMTKKAEEYMKQLEIQDPMVQRPGDIAGEDTDYMEMLKQIENRM